MKSLTAEDKKVKFAIVGCGHIGKGMRKWQLEMWKKNWLPCVM